MIGLIGDVHGEDLLLRRALDTISSKGITEIYCVGDIVDGVGDVEACCTLLKEADVICVAGNHDRWILKGEMRTLNDATSLDSLSSTSINFLRSLPKTRILRIEGVAVILCHGLLENDMNRLTPDDFGYALEANFELQNLINSKAYRYVFNGHTHRAMVRKFGDLTVINAGTLKRQQDPSVTIVDVKNNKINLISL